MFHSLIHLSLVTGHGSVEMSREFGHCKRCNKYKFDAHLCKCVVYEYWIDGWSDDDDPQEISSSYSDLEYVCDDIAAKHYQENGEYDPEDFEEIIYVRLKEDGENEYTKFRSTAEIEVTYSSRKCND